jgi:uncharacterized protein
MKPRKVIKRLLLVVAAGVIWFAYASLETRWVKITPVTIESHDIPAAFDGKKIVFVSDIQYGAYMSRDRIVKLVQRINAIQPDIIVLGGDYSSREQKYVIPVFDELRKLKSKYGVFGVMGNHDYFVNGDLTKRMMARNGINVCDNKSYWVKIKKDSIKIGGVDDPVGDIQELDSTVYDVHRKDFCILISHRPDYVKEIKTDLIDLTLSGHTHGGQVTFFGLWAPILPSDNGFWASLTFSMENQKYCYGLFQRSPTMQSYITSGFGSRYPHLRFFRRPEIAVLELKRK